ncbi:MAG: hypothetical protein K8R02_00710 [Anaerohalosphaeraceae bacterium]|nr:hypothetical protein [Anaerohalosphaeraceae bacterium]
MARTVIVSILVLTLFAATGYGDSQKRFMVDNPGPSVFENLTPSAVTEVAMAEDLAQKRLIYHRQLEELQAYYTQTGNMMKLEWVTKEFNALLSAPRYSYIIQAEVAGSELLAVDSINKADRIYDRAVLLYNSATKFPLFANKKKMRLALVEFNDLIKNYPTCDKIDDAAYLAGRIHEYFKDYAIAVLYYKRSFQWNSENPYPARYRAARILDHKLAERSEALRLYRGALEKEAKQTANYKEIIQERIDVLTAPPGTETIR